MEHPCPLQFFLQSCVLMERACLRFQSNVKRLQLSGNSAYFIFFFPEVACLTCNPLSALESISSILYPVPSSVTPIPSFLFCPVLSCPFLSCLAPVLFYPILSHAWFLIRKVVKAALNEKEDSFLREYIPYPIWSEPIYPDISESEMRRIFSMHSEFF